MPRSVQPDRKLFIVTLALCLIGVVMVFSASAMTASEQFGAGYIFLLRQLIYVVLGIAGMFWLMNMDYRRLRQPRVVFTGLALSFVLLVGVFFLDRSHQTHRWFRMGPFSFQPSEMAKLALIIFLAWFLELRRLPRNFGVNNWLHTLAPALGTTVVMAALVVKEPDMGTAFMIVLISMVMLFVAGLSYRYIAGTVLAAIPTIYLLIVRVPYRLQRFEAFLHPELDPKGAGFQLLQSLISVGSGGMTGVGLMESRQKLFYLPEAHTDFIYAVLCEELGFIGGVLVLALFAMHMLPVNFTGLLLIIVAFIFFVLEAKFPTHGVLGVGGVIAMVLGALMLIRSPFTGMGVSLSTALGVALPFAVIIVILMRLVLRSRNWKQTTGKEELVGEEAEVTETVGAGNAAGMVFVHGELWRAAAPAGVSIPKGVRVRVRKVKGLTLEVEPAHAPHPAHSHETLEGRQ